MRLDERKLKIARYLFDRHGTKMVFFGRFVSVLRTYAAFLAGVIGVWFLVCRHAGRLAVRAGGVRCEAGALQSKENNDHRGWH